MLFQRGILMRTGRIVVLSLLISVSFLLTTFLYVKNTQNNFHYEMFFDSEDIFSVSGNFINCAEDSLDICVYSISSDYILELLKDALKRGVSLRIITDDSNLKFVEQLMVYGAKIYSDDENGLMHCKYMISDGKNLWAGSANLTDTGLHANNNDILITDDPRTVNVFKSHFDNLTSNDDIFVHNGGTGIGEVYFTLFDDVFSNIIHHLSFAKKSVKIGIYAFSDYRIAHYLKILSSYGVEIKIIADKEWNSIGSYSVVRDLSDFSFSVLDNNSEGKMHEKFMIIDDKKVLFGSYNFTLSANDKNYEFVIISEKEEIVRGFMNHFESLMEDIENAE